MRTQLHWKTVIGSHVRFIALYYSCRYDTGTVTLGLFVHYIVLIFIIFWFWFWSTYVFV